MYSLVEVVCWDLDEELDEVVVIKVVLATVLEEEEEEEEEVELVLALVLVVEIDVVVSAVDVVGALEVVATGLLLVVSEVVVSRSEVVEVAGSEDVTGGCVDEVVMCVVVAGTLTGDVEVSTTLVVSGTSEEVGVPTGTDVGSAETVVSGGTEVVLLPSSPDCLLANLSTRVAREGSSLWRTSRALVSVGKTP